MPRVRCTVWILLSVLVGVTNGKTQRIFAIGGEPYSSAVDVYDLRTKTWSTATALPEGRSGLTAASVNGVVYAIGGESSDETHATVWAYRSNAWTSGSAPVANMSQGRFSHAACVLAGKIYVTGGFNNAVIGGTLNTSERYDPSKNKWEPIADLPTPRQNHFSACVGDSVYVFGGEVPNQRASPTVLRYSTTTGKWSSATPMPAGRSMACATVLGNKVYIAGGHDGSDFFFPRKTSSVFVFDPAHQSWSHAANMTTERTECGAVTAGNRIYVVGGRYHPADVETYNVANDTWTLLPELATRSWLSSFGIAVQE